MKFKTLLAAAFLLASLAVAPAAALLLTDPVNAFGVGSTNPASALSYAVVSARSANGGAPIVQFLSYGSDLAAGKVQFYKVDAETSCTFSNTTVTLQVVATNGLADNGTIVIRHKVNDLYEKRTLTTSTGATNLVCTVAPNGGTGSVVPGDIIYHVTTTGAGSISIGALATTNTLAGSAIYGGQKGLPLLIEINGTSAATLFGVGGRYEN